MRKVTLVIVLLFTMGGGDRGHAGPLTMPKTIVNLQSLIQIFNTGEVELTDFLQ